MHQQTIDWQKVFLSDEVPSSANESNTDSSVGSAKKKPSLLTDDDAVMEQFFTERPNRFCPCLLFFDYRMGHQDVRDSHGVSTSEMTYFVSGGALNSNRWLRKVSRD